MKTGKLVNRKHSAVIEVRFESNISQKFRAVTCGKDVISAIIEKPKKKLRSNFGRQKKVYIDPGLKLRRSFTITTQKMWNISEEGVTAIHE